MPDQWLKIIQPLVRLLKKQGLVRAFLSYRGNDYRYSPETGLTVTGPEPVKIREVSSRQNGVKKTPFSYRLTLALLFVAVVLFIGIIVLNQQLSRKDDKSVNLLNPITGESAVVTGLPEEDNGVLRDDAKINQKAAIETEDRNELVKDQPVKDQMVNRPGDDSGKADNRFGSDVRQGEVAGKAEPYREAISIRNISPALIPEYHARVNTLRIELPRKVIVSGMLAIDLNIDQNGKVVLFSLLDSGVEVRPDSRRSRVIMQLKQMISGLRFKPAVDRSGRPVRVENWRLNFMVTQFKRRMILRKQ